MRPIASEQNPTRYPLSIALGTEAQVRLLRVLAMDVDGPISVADAARRSGLTVPGARKAVSRLESAAILQAVGGGRSTLYELRRGEPLVVALVSLFGVERKRFCELIGELRRHASALAVPYLSVWIESLPASVGATLRVGVLSGPDSLARAVNELGSIFAGVEQKFEVTIEVTGYTRADLSGSDADVVELLAGVPPGPPAPAHRARGKPRDRHEQRSLELGKSVASLLRQDPSLTRRAREHIETLLAGAPGTAAGDLRQWLRILRTYSPFRLERLLTSSSERAARLLQSNPFLPVLTGSERKALVGRSGGEE